MQVLNLFSSESEASFFRPWRNKEKSKQSRITFKTDWNLFSQTNRLTWTLTVHRTVAGSSDTEWQCYRPRGHSTPPWLLQAYSSRTSPETSYFFNHNSLVTLAFLFKSFNVLHFSLYRHIGPPAVFHSKSFNDGLPLLIKPPNVVCLASKQALLFGFRLLTVIYSCSADWRFRVGEWNKGKQAVISTCKLLHASQTNSVCQKLHELRNGSQTEPCIEQLNPEQKLTL